MRENIEIENNFTPYVQNHIDQYEKQKYEIIIIEKSTSSKKSLFYRKQNIYAWKSIRYQIWKVMIILQYILLSLLKKMTKNSKRRARKEKLKKSAADYKKK